MKRVKRREYMFLGGILLFLPLFLLTGCAKTTTEADIQRSGEENVSEEVAQEGMQEENVSVEVVQEAVGEEGIQETSNSNKEDVDYDLTKMGSDMVYATVYQMMVDPTTYEGKTVRVNGNYYGGWYEPTAQYYFYVIIEDAMACCSQGLEFIWEDGSHVYPDEYPADGSEVEVTGIYETYQEEGDQTIYCRLKDAELITME